MKNLIFFIVLSILSIELHAQIASDITIDGGSIRFIRPNATGGWARGLFFLDHDEVTRIGGMGMLGTGDNTIHRMYLAHGEKPWSSGQGLYVLPDGKTGIGITIPVTKLDVNGNMRVGNVSTPSGYKLYVEEGIITEKVVVAKHGTINWADYVFEKDYDRNTIKEVEDYIQQNKHLPNVPSTQEVNDNGINMVEMDATLLRQIEELWLNMIDLNDKLTNLEKENKQLKKKLRKKINL